MRKDRHDESSSRSSYFANALKNQSVNPLNAELNPICHFLALLGAHPILHVSRIRANAAQGNDMCCRTAHN